MKRHNIFLQDRRRLLASREIRRLTSEEEEDTIVVKGLRKSFKKLTVLEGVDFSVKKGTVLALLGPNGAGKTTIIRILSTLLLPDSGQALINGFDVVKNANKVRSLIGLTGQYAALDEYLTGKENLHMIGRLYRLNYLADHILG